VCKPLIISYSDKKTYFAEAFIPLLQLSCCAEVMPKNINKRHSRKLLELSAKTKRMKLIFCCISYDSYSMNQAIVYD